MRTRLERERVRAERVELADVVPDTVSFVGQLAILQLDAFMEYSQCARQAPRITTRRAAAHAASHALKKHDQLTELLSSLEADPIESMQRFAEPMARFRALTEPGNWQEGLLGAHVTTGILDEFFLRLAVGLDDEMTSKIRTILSADDGRDGVVLALRDEIEADDDLSSRLALWGRRMVGDVLLVARSALAQSVRQVGDGRAVGAKDNIEPVMTELIASHTRRMDELGLTA